MLCRGLRARRASSRLALGILGSLLLAGAAPAPAVTFGAAGDSLTDEYQFVGGLPALNFVEQLIFYRGLDFGPRVLDPAVRGEPRNEGFEHNWARFGATANEPTYSDVNLFRELPRLGDMPLFQVQVDGLALDIAAGNVDVVYVGIGANDVFIHLFLGRPFQGPIFQAFVDALVTTTFNAVDSFLTAGASHVFVGAVPDQLVPNPGAHPPISPFIDPADLAAAVAEINQALAQQAAARANVHFVNLFSEIEARTDAGGNVTVGSVGFSNQSFARLSQLILNPAPGEPHGPCNLEGTFCATQDYAFNYYAHDRVHPNTLIQGLMANAFVAALNDQLGLGIAPFSDEELIQIATSPVPVPEPARAVGLACALAGLAALRRHRRKRRSR